MEFEHNIVVKVIADSISEHGKRITTFELTYPRIIHSELMTHRLFSRNAMSSRAVPIHKMVAAIRESMAMPVRFGANQSGMQDKGEEHEAVVKVKLGAAQLHLSGRDAWKVAGGVMCDFALAFEEAKYHKQVANRLIEPFQMMRTVLTATDFNNFRWLRCDADADPTFETVAEMMMAAYDNSTPELLKAGQWHTPYVEHWEDAQGNMGYMIKSSDVEGGEDTGPYKLLTEEEALAISASCCAQVSYRMLNSTYEKALDIYSRLVSGKKVHASPFEHQATPMDFDNQGEKRMWMMANVDIDQDTDMWGEGVTHVDRDGTFWSGNLRGWVQNRQLIEGNVKRG